MKHIKIANITYAFHIEDNLTTPEGEAAYGNIKHSDQTLLLSSDFPSKQKRDEVLLHEIIHGVIHLYGVDSMIDPENEESIVTILARGMMQVFQDNPDLVKELFNGNTTRSIRIRK